MNWLGVKNLDLAVSIMKDQGIQNVALDRQQNLRRFRARVGRGGAPLSGTIEAQGPELKTDCGPSDCHWISLDPPSSKCSITIRESTSTALSFDYTSYYNAIKNSDSARTNKNPLEIYEEQILACLRRTIRVKLLKMSITRALSPH